ncbi:MAG TPA: response regulator transcription factor [Candidatus Saccharimonadales bacterium]
MKVLIIEDNQWLARSIKDYLKTSFTVDIALTSEEGLEKALNVQYAVIILDLNLPDADGYETCRILRDRHVSSPILVLTGFKEPTRCVKLLDGGADDYMTKPFNSAELRARISALTRRRYEHESGILRFRDLIIDVARRHVERAGTVIELRRKEFDILEYLIMNRGRVVTREMILNHAWDGDKNSWNNTVDVHIKHLRDKVDRPFAPPLIKTAYGIGYKVDDIA